MITQAQLIKFAKEDLKTGQLILTESTQGRHVDVELEDGTYVFTLAPTLHDAVDDIPGRVIFTADTLDKAAEFLATLYIIDEE